VALSVDGPSLVDLDTDESRPADLAAALGDGAWAPDGSEVALVELRGRGQLVLLDTGTGEARKVADGAGAQGSVVWSPDSERFAFARIDPDDRFRLQAVVCTSDSGCVPAFTWERGVHLLGFTSLTR
jgi:dipeptidyl aminopeptidase/acylaminoacyl peptidase